MQARNPEGKARNTRGRGAGRARRDDLPRSADAWHGTTTRAGEPEEQRGRRGAVLELPGTNECSTSRAMQRRAASSRSCPPVRAWTFDATHRRRAHHRGRAIVPSRRDLRRPEGGPPPREVSVPRPRRSARRAARIARSSSTSRSGAPTREATCSRATTLPGRRRRARRVASSRGQGAAGRCGRGAVGRLALPRRGHRERVRRLPGRAASSVTRRARRSSRRRCPRWPRPPRPPASTRTASRRCSRSIAADPERAFDDLRELLFDATSTLFACAPSRTRALALALHDGHRFAPLLHRYELSNWVLYARAYGDARAGRARARDRREAAQREAVARLARARVGRAGARARVSR